MRHLDVRHLWLQDAVAHQEIEVRRVPGEENPADLLTKYLPIKQVVHQLKGLAISWISRSLTIATEGGCRTCAPFQSLTSHCEDGG